MVKEKLQILLQYLLPQHVLSRLTGKIANCRIPWIKDPLINLFIRHFGVDMNAALQSDPRQYASFNEFFTRKLKPELRPIASNASDIICPVDGVISQLGILQNEQLIQAKGFEYGLLQLLGGSIEHAKTFSKGHYINLYLGPKDYHRVHMPFTGVLREMIYVPGQLFSVNCNTACHIPNLFTRNERVITIFDTIVGPMAVVWVGAMLVASIHTTWAGTVTPSKSCTIQSWKYSGQSIKLAQGEEMGYFQYGSTVIVLFPQDCISWKSGLNANHVVQYGQLLGIRS